MIQMASDKALIYTKNHITLLDKKLTNSITDETLKLKENVINLIKFNQDQTQENTNKIATTINTRITQLEK